MREMTTIKKFLFLISLSFCLVPCFGQKIIQLQENGGVYTIPCSVNGVSGNFVFDTGATSVTLSMSFANKLYQQGKLKDDDIIGFGKAQVANGQIVENVVIRIKSLTIAGLNFGNVNAVVIKGQNAPLLLGLSAIQKLGKVTLSGNRLIVENKLLSSKDVVTKKAQIENYIYNDNYSQALEILKRLEEQKLLDNNELYNIALCYAELEDYNKCMIYCQQWLGDYENTGLSLQNEIYYLLGMSYHELGDYTMCNNTIAKAALSDDASDLAKSRYYAFLALNALKADKYDRSVEAFDLAAQCRLKALNYTLDDLMLNKVHDEKIGTWLNSIGTIYGVFIKDNESCVHYNIFAAKCGNEASIKFCESLKIDFE